MAKREVTRWVRGVLERALLFVGTRYITLGTACLRLHSVVFVGKRDVTLGTSCTNVYTAICGQEIRHSGYFVY